MHKNSSLQPGSTSGITPQRISGHHFPTIEDIRSHQTHSSQPQIAVQPASAYATSAAPLWRPQGSDCLAGGARHFRSASMKAAGVDPSGQVCVEK